MSPQLITSPLLVTTRTRLTLVSTPPRQNLRSTSIHHRFNPLSPNLWIRGVWQSLIRSALWAPPANGSSATPAGGLLCSRAAPLLPSTLLTSLNRSGLQPNKRHRLARAGSDRYLRSPNVSGHLCHSFHLRLHFHNVTFDTDSP